MNKETIEWLKTEEGNDQYMMWMADLVGRAKSIVKVDMTLSASGELLVPVHLEKSEIPYAIKRDPNFCNNNNLTFNIEFQIKNIILEEIGKMAEARNQAREEEGVFLVTDEELYAEIEKAIVKDMCIKALQAKEYAIESFNKAVSFKVDNSTIVPVFSQEEVKKEVNKKTGFFRRIVNHVWEWYNGA